MLFLTIVFINVLLPVLAEPIARIRQSGGEHQEKSIQYNEIRSSKLRILLLGDLLKSKFVPLLPDINCLATTSSINVTANKCSCANFLCKSKERSIGIVAGPSASGTAAAAAATSLSATTFGFNSTLSKALTNNNAIPGNHRMKQRPIHTTCYDVCCRNKHKKTVSRSIDPQLHIPSLSRNNAVLHVDEQYNIRNSKNSYNNSKAKKPNQNSYNTCSSSHNNNNNTRPSNGTRTAAAAGWLVWIQSKSGGECAGSVIHEKMVLTTAVCVFKMRADDLLVQMEQFSTGKNQWQLMNRKVRQIIYPDNFAKTMEQLRNNIAILVLENNGDDVVDKRTMEAIADGNEEIVKSHFNTICLPTKNIELNGYNNCYVASWTGNYHEKLPRKIVQVNDLRIFAMDECRELHNNRTEDYNKYFHDGNICAGKADTSDISISLSGSPLICVEERNQINHFVIPGLLTWSTRINKSPHLFTNVFEYTNWIHEQMIKLELY